MLLQHVSFILYSLITLTMTYFGLHIKNSDDKLKDLSDYNYISCFQIFIDSPKRNFGKLSKTKEEKLKNLIIYANENKILCFVHAPYNINIANTLTDPKSKNLDYWVKSVIKELIMANSLGIKAVILHVGKYKDLDQRIALQNMKLTLGIIYKYIKHLGVELLLETPAGQGTELLSNLNDFLNFYKELDHNIKEKIFICIDTCHMFSSGVDIRSESKIDNVMKHIDKIVGLKSVHLIHLNDSATDFNSKRDRHESILGDGKIGLKNIKHIFKWAIKFKIPCILETPGDDKQKELDILHKWNMA